MSIVDSIILGLIQGITEFLPISSTGHLILSRSFLGITDSSGLAFDAVLQLSTSLAVLIYFRKDFINLFNKTINFIRRVPGDYIYVKAIIAGTIPAIILGLSFEDYISAFFRNPLSVAVALIAGSILFYVAEKLGKQNQELSTKKGLAIGFFQALAIIPGMSRSGSTISGGLISGLSRIEAARFSFILSFPIIFGAGVYKLIDLVKDDALVSLGSSLLIGSFFAFISGMIAIHYLLKYLKSHTLNIFIFYRLFLAAVIIMISL
jgi:undecaprenyl-diphosphatase